MKQFHQYSRVTFLLLCLLLSLPAYPWDFEVDGFCYDKISDSTCALALPTGHGSLSYYTGDVIIPERVTYRGVEYTVTEIASCALSRSKTSGSSITYNEDLLSVVIPATIEIIHRDAFRGCCKLTSIVIPSSVKSVGYTAFEGCSMISEVTLEEGFEPISFSCGNTNYRGVFSDCPLKKVFIGRDIELVLFNSNYDNFCLSNGPFSWKTTLTDVTISENVTSIPQYLFYSNSNMTNIILGNNITRIGTGAFKNCTKLSSIIIGTSLESIDYQAFINTSNDLKIYLFSNNLSKIGDEICPTTSSFYVLNKDIYSTLLADYTINNMFEVDALSTEYTGKPCNIKIINNTEFQLSNIQNIINSGKYDSLSADIIVYAKIVSVSIPCKINISQALATIIAKDCSRKYGMQNPDFSYSVFGLKNGESASVINVQPTIQTTADEFSAPGTYPIIPYGAEAQNYTFNYERGTLTISKADQTIEWEQQFDTVYVGDIVELKAASSANLPIKYTLTDETLAEVLNLNGKKYVEFLKPGTVSIRATQDGNENYNEADRVSKEVTITPKIITVTDLTLNKTEVSLRPTETVQLTATIAPETATNKSIIWGSTNASVASVDGNGLVTAISVGEVYITATANDGTGISAKCKITVEPVIVESLTISPTDFSGTQGDSFTINVKILPENATNKDVVFLTNNDGVAMVDNFGLVTIGNAGSAIVRVETTDGSNLSADCIITSQTSGIDEMFEDNITVYDVYNLNGMLIEKDADKDDIRRLQNGIYLIRQGNKVKILYLRTN